MEENTIYQYRRIYNELVELVRAGCIHEGDRLPTEHELMRRYSVSRITGQKALRLLQDQGYVARYPGRGTYLTKEGLEALAQSPSDDRDPANGGTRLLGIVADDLEESYGLHLYYDLDRAASKEGYRLIIRTSYGDQAREAEEIDYLRSLGAEGIFVLPARAEYYNNAILRLLLENYPVLVVDCMLRGVQVHSVASDNVLGGYMMTRHLIDLGHTDIALISQNRMLAVSLEDRCRGYRKALEDSGLPFARANVLESLGWLSHSQRAAGAVEDIVRRISAFLEENRHITAAAVSQYSLASLVKLAAERLGRRVPEDLSIVTFDECYDMTGGFFFTHVKQDESGIAETCMRNMLRLLKREPVPQSEYLPPKLMLGRSSGPVRK